MKIVFFHPDQKDLLFFVVLLTLNPFVWASHELYFQPFVLEFSDSHYRHLSESYPGILALKLNIAGLPSFAPFLPKKSPEVSRFEGYLVKGKILKSAENIFELKMIVEKAQSGKNVKEFYVKGNLTQIWQETTPLALQIAEGIGFYLDPVDQEKIRQWELSVPSFQQYIQGLAEEYAGRYESAAALYLSVSKQEKSAPRGVEQQRLKCLFRFQSMEFEEYAKYLLEKEDDDLEVLYLKARIDYQQEETFRAHHWMRRALEKNPKHQATRVTQMCIQALEKDFNAIKKNLETLSIYEEQLAILPFAKLMTAQVGTLSEEQIDALLEEGLRLLEDEDPWILHFGATALNRHKQQEKAQELLKRALKPAKLCGYDSFVERDLIKKYR